MPFVYAPSFSKCTMAYCNEAAEGNQENFKSVA